MRWRCGCSRRLFFFVPQGLVVTELSSRFPQEGGIYQWTKRALGEKHGYVCGWCYWINNVLYYPNLLISTAVIATYVDREGRERAREQLDVRAVRRRSSASGSRC